MVHINARFTESHARGLQTANGGGDGGMGQQRLNGDDEDNLLWNARLMFS